MGQQLPNLVKALKSKVSKIREGKFLPPNFFDRRIKTFQSRQSKWLMN